MNYLIAQFRKSLASSKTTKAFSLIELMVVISIIAVLAIIGSAVYGNLTTRARDSRRDADLESISKALEAGYDNSTASYTLLATNFQGGSVPTDPIPSVQTYCVWGSTTEASQATNPAGFVGTPATCTASAQNVNSVSGQTLGSSTVSGWKWFKVCVYHEVTTGTRLVCKNNQRS